MFRKVGTMKSLHWRCESIFCLCIRVHVHAYVYVCACMRVWVHVYMYVYVYVYVCVCVFIHIYIHACVGVHMNSCRRILFNCTVQSLCYMRVYHRCFLTPACVCVGGLAWQYKNRQSTRSWTARVRLVHSWVGYSTKAVEMLQSQVYMYFFIYVRSSCGSHTNYEHNCMYELQIHAYIHMYIYAYRDT